MQKMKYPWMALMPFCLFFVPLTSKAGVNPHLRVDSVAGAANAQVTAPVRVFAFNNITSMQGTIQFDTSIVAYDSLSQFGLPAFTSASFGLSQTAAGVLTYSWMDADSSGESLGDSSVLFAIRFNLVGEGGHNSSVCFANSPLTLEVADVNADSILVTYDCGVVHIICDSLDCADNISCTIDTCVNGSCLNIPIVINLGNIEGPPCAAVNTTSTYSIDSLGPDYLYQWQVNGIGLFEDTIADFWETNIAWNDTGVANLSAIVFNRTCSDTALLNILVVEDANCCPNRCPPVSIDEVNNAITLTVLPNPNSWQFSFQLEGGLDGTVEVQLLNLIGQSVYETSYSLNNGANAHNIRLNEVEPGVYLLKVQIGEETLLQRVLLVE